MLLYVFKLCNSVVNQKKFSVCKLQPGTIKVPHNKQVVIFSNYPYPNLSVPHGANFTYGFSHVIDKPLYKRTYNNLYTIVTSLTTLQ